MSAGNATANARAVFLVDPTGVPYSGARPVYTVDTNGAYVAGGGSGFPGTTAASLTQAAIEAAITTAGVNGIVNLPAGTATLTAALVPLAGQTIRGAGIRATTLTLPTATTINAFNLSAANVTVTDLGIDGNRAAQAVDLGQTTNAGAYVTAASATFRRVWIRGMRGMGISATSGGQYLTVEDSYIDGGHTVNTGTTGGVSKGIYCQGTRNVKIRRNTITGWSQAVGLWYGNTDCWVTDNDIINNYGFEDAGHTVNRSACEDYGATTGTNARNTFARNLVDGSTARCFEIAQGVQGSRYLNNITRNAGILGSTGHHIEVTGDAPGNTTDILIQGNTVYGDATLSAVLGIVVNGNALRTTIANNVLRDFAHASLAGAIFIGGTAVTGKVTISGNSLTNCQVGIRLNSNPNGMAILGNTIETVTGDAIYLGSGNGHLVEGNVCGNPFSYGINAALGSRHRIIGNHITSANGGGIQLASNDCFASGNYCLNTAGGGQGGITISSSRNTVRDNYCADGVSRDIVISGSGDYNLIQGNMLANNTVYTVGATGTHNTIEPNHTATVTKALTLKSLGAQTVGTTQATIAHGLGYTPTVVELTMTSAGTIWKSAVADATNIYLTSDLAGRTADVYVR